MTQRTDSTYFYSPSINIERDSKSQINYIPTLNGELVFNQIEEAVKVGIRSFSIVGAYGSGKSAFLWALEKNLSREKAYFVEHPVWLEDITSFEFINFVGNYLSIQSSFAQKFDVIEEDVIAKLGAYAKSLRAECKGIFIRIDEFGKYLEFAAQHNPEKELYFLQQLAELANDTNQSIILLTTLHQDFSAYSFNLQKRQRNEWDKVKGRFKEITFNEPVEQLLFLASERLDEYNYDFPSNRLKALEEAIGRAQIFPLRDYFNADIAKKILPLDLLSASTLTLALQRYGQNERSLFSFIEANDFMGLKSFLETRPFPLFNLVLVYDYLNHHFYNYLNTKYNIDYAQWAAISASIERAEGVMTNNLATGINLIKIIGLLNIFSKKSAKVNRDFIKDYAAIAIGIQDLEDALEQLENFKIIRNIKHQNKYVLFEGTDVDIELAIDQAGVLVEQVRDVTKHLNEVFDLPFIPAKKYHYETGTPRFFTYRITEEPIIEVPKEEIDGFINLIFSTNIDGEAIRAQSNFCEEAILYVLFKNTLQIQQLITEIEKVKKAKQDNLGDRVAAREFDNILSHQKKLLNHFVLDKLQSPDDEIEFYFKGEQKRVTNSKSFNHLLSEICYRVYHETPLYLNEMVNKTKLSSAISLARKKLIGRLINNVQEKDLGFPEKKYPPEKTIYLSLIKETGVHRYNGENYELGEPSFSGFNHLWNASIAFLDECKHTKRSLNDLVEKLSQKPFKAKNGFVEFWLPVFLIIKKDDYALFSKEGYIPFITPDTLELIVKKPKDYDIKAFDVAGVKLEVFNKYRELINQTKATEAGNQGFIETIKPFLAFYRGLPDYAKKTKSISRQAQSLRTAIAQSKDPERAFFEDLPQALGYSLNDLNTNHQRLESYFNELKDIIKQIRTSYQQLLERFEAFILEEVVGRPLDFEDWKQLLINRFENIKSYTLSSHQKTFFQRIKSPLDDKKAWLNSIAQAVLNKSLEQIDDQEEHKLYDRFKELIHELDNLSEITTNNIDAEQENVVRLEITSLLEGVQKRLVRFPKSMDTKTGEIEDQVKSVLSKDKNLNIYILTELLKEQLKENE